MAKKDELLELLRNFLAIRNKKGFSSEWDKRKFINEILEIMKPQKNQETINKATITLTTLLNGLIKGDFFLEDFPEAIILKLKILLQIPLDSEKP